MVLEIGTILADRYKILSVLGEGGAGVVYHVEDTQVTFQKRELALKVLDERYYDNKEVLNRFQNELLITEQFSHENIVRAGSFEHVDDKYFITMEYVNGKNAKELIEEYPAKLPIQRVIQILYATASALEYAHSKGIIHRDVKPDNILMDDSGSIKVSDFGIARPLENYQALTVQDDFVGTRTYMSPEQLRSSSEIDYRTDIYSLGIVAFELLTGHPPFEAESEFVISNMHCTSPIPSALKENPDAPAWMQSFIEKCCEKEASNRFQSMSDIKKLLRLHLKEEQTGDGNSLTTKSAGEGGLSAYIWHWKLYFNRRKNFLKKIMIAALLGYLNFYFLFPNKALVYSGELGHALEPLAFDYWFPLRDKIQGTSPPDKTSIVYIDSASYTQLNANLLKPFPRKFISEALLEIAKHRPKKVILDMVALDNSSGHETKEAEERALKEAYNLAAAFSKAPTYLARTRILEVDPDQHLRSVDGLRSAKLFLNSIKGEFYANLFASKGVIRHFYHGEHDWYVPTPMAPIVFDNKIPAGGAPQVGEYINYYGKSNSISSVPLYRILQGDFNPTLITDRYIFLGRKPDPTSEKDSFYTPYRVKVPGVEIHATILSNIVDKEWIKRLPRGAETFLVIAITTLLCYAIITAEPRVGLLLTIGSSSGAFALSFLLFLNTLYVPGLITLPLLLFGTYLFAHVTLLQRVYAFLENIGFERKLK